MRPRWGGQGQANGMARVLGTRRSVLRCQRPQACVGRMQQPHLPSKGPELSHNERPSAPPAHLFTLNCQA